MHFQLLTWALVYLWKVISAKKKEELPRKNSPRIICVSSVQSWLVTSKWFKKGNVRETDSVRVRETGTGTQKTTDHDKYATRKKNRKEKNQEWVFVCLEPMDRYQADDRGTRKASLGVQPIEHACWHIPGRSLDDQFRQSGGAASKEMEHLPMVDSESLGKTWPLLWLAITLVSSQRNPELWGMLSTGEEEESVASDPRAGSTTADWQTFTGCIGGQRDVEERFSHVVWHICCQPH